MLFVLALVKGSAADFHPQMEINLAAADLTMIGEESGDWAAYFASPAGDVNGDGLFDILIGAPMAGNKVCPFPGEDPCPGLPKGEGIAYLVLGRPRPDWPSNAINLAEADASFLGCEVTSMTARQLYTAGDVNGDGYDDILISGWKCGLNYTGKAYLILGRPDVDSWGAEFPVEEADASFLGEHESDQASYYTSTAGDVNGDGYDDFLITSTHNDEQAENAGQVYLILGRGDADWGRDYDLAAADASFLGEAEEDRLGRSATGVGDVNGDGYDDFLIGSISNDEGGVDAGQSYLFLGRAREGDPDYDPDRPWWGPDYPASQADASFIGETPGDESGRRVAKAGDVNGDGLGDFLIGAALNDQAGPDAGKAYLIFGRPSADWGRDASLSDADASFMGEDRLDQAGRRVSGAGDVNQDGFHDFLIGAPHFTAGEDDPDSWSEGRVYLIYGREGADWGQNYPLARADILYTGKPEVGAAGYDMAWIGDHDGDGLDDFLIGAYGGRNNNQVPGEAYLLLGSAAPLPFRFIPDHEVGWAGGWARFTGDYWGIQGWQAIQSVYLTLQKEGQSLYDFEVSYEPQGDLLYLHDRGTSERIGPCSPGDLQKLSNYSVELDCRGSNAVTEDEIVRVSWRIRWGQPTIPSQSFSVYLRAVDVEENDSGYRGFGTWSLVNNRSFLPLVGGKGPIQTP
jgi:hypothetical protein